MSFSMSPFPLRFGSRQGGGGESGPLSAAQLRTDLAALGFTVTRSGAKQSHILGSGGLGFEDIGANVATFERATVGSRDHLGILVFPQSTPLVANSNNLTGWSTTGSPSVVYTASGGVNDAGYTTITGTGGAWTVSLSLTRGSANRRSRIRYYAPSSNSGAITLSQDDSSTSTNATEDSFQDLDLTAQTASNPVLEIAGSGTDTITIYDFQHSEPSANYPSFKWFEPQGDTPAAVGADAVSRSIGVAPTTIDLEILVKNIGASPLNLFNIYGAAGNAVYCESNSNILSVRRTISAAFTQLTNLSLTTGAIGLLQVQCDASQFRARINRGSWVSSTAGIPVTSAFAVGSNGGGDRQFRAPIMAFRDNTGDLLGTAGATWNPLALADFEATL